MSKPNPIIYKADDGKAYLYNSGPSSLTFKEVHIPVIKTKKKFAFSLDLQYIDLKTQYQNELLSGNSTIFEMPRNFILRFSTITTITESVVKLAAYIDISINKK